MFNQRLFFPLVDSCHAVACCVPKDDHGIRADRCLDGFLPVGCCFRPDRFPPGAIRDIPFAGKPNFYLSIFAAEHSVCQCRHTPSRTVLWFVLFKEVLIPRSALSVSPWALDLLGPVRISCQLRPIRRLGRFFVFSWPFWCFLRPAMSPSLDRESKSAG